MQTAYLILHSTDGDQSIALDEGCTLFAGRTAECDLCLPSPAVSRRHAVILVRGGHYGIKDLKSSNGTYLNGQRLTRPVRLRHGDVIQMGPFSLRFEALTAPAYNTAEQTSVLSEDDLAKMLAPRSDAAPVAGDSPAPDVARRRLASTVRKTSDSASAGKTSVRPSEAGEASAPMNEPQPAAAAPFVPGIDAAPAPGAASVSPLICPQTPAGSEGRNPMTDDEAGDEACDAGFMEKDDDASDQDSELALARAAAEAGLMGEFTPDVPEPVAGNGSGPEGVQMVSESTPDPFAYDMPGSVELPPPPETGPGVIPVDASFRDVIEARLCLYSFLHDMQKERQQLVAGHPELPEAVGAELNRQEREMQKLPPADKAEAMIAKRREKRRELGERVAEAKKIGIPLPPRPSRLMREAEEIAINQWTIIAQSARESLPAVFSAGFRLMQDEPLAECLGNAGIGPTTLMGGAAYYLGLERMLVETRYNRAFLKAKLAGMKQPGEKKGGGRNGLLGIFGRKNAETGDEAAPGGDSFAEVAEAEEHMARRMTWIEQELAFIENLLIKEFWDVYLRVALSFIPRPQETTMALRAFLRYGVISFSPWFLGADARAHVMNDCTNNVVKEMTVSRSITNILYADEYLVAVLNGKCTPAMDENLEINAKNSPEWKADKALRRVINCRSQIALLRELLDSLSETIRETEEKSAAFDGRLATLLPGSKNYKQVKNELEQQRQACRVEVVKLGKLSEKISQQVLANLEEQIADTEKRFASGELPRPEPKFLIRREVEAIRKIGRLLSNLKERFMPLVMREFFIPDTDAVNDRASIEGELAGIERRDPAVFLEFLAPSKKKQNRVDLRISPVVVLVPSAGVLAFSWNPRQRPENGRLGIPTCFIRHRLRERQLIHLMSDFRWDTAKAAAGMDLMNSDTIVAAFMAVRWDWRKRSKDGREKGLIYTEQNDRTNWRRIYETYMESAYDGGKKLFNRNHDFYERIFVKYFDPPDGVEFLRR